MGPVKQLEGEYQVGAPRGVDRRGAEERNPKHQRDH